MPKGNYTKKRFAYLATAAKLLKKTQYKYKRPFTEENIKEQHKKRMKLIKSEKLEAVFENAPPSVTKEKFIKQEKERFKNKINEINNE